MYRRKETWRLLKDLAIQDDLPWCCFRDFNKILWDHEKSKRCLRREGQMVEFWKALDDCQLEYLSFTGNWYTWEKGNNVVNNIKERIDKIVASRRWCELYPNFIVKHAPRIVSDHCPIIIDTEWRVRKTTQNAIRKFRFEAMWVNEE